jgi:HPt (histidine-containing phosphotransfer) domain-containing protein
MRAVMNIVELEKQTGKPLLREIFSGFQSQVIEKFGELELELSRKEAENVSRIAHAIKSMSANVGAEQLKQISAQIELLAKSGDVSKVGALTYDLQKAYSVFVEEFGSLLIEWKAANEA